VIRRHGLPRADWPEPDQIAWAAAIAMENRFHRGPAAHWASTTRHAVEVANARWLGYLAVSDPSALTEHLLERLTEDRLTRYLDRLAETVGSIGRHSTKPSERPTTGCSKYQDFRRQGQPYTA
jgi:hypothetical protein